MYKYESERDKIFTDEGQRKFILVRDNIKKLLSVAGAVSMVNAFKVISGDTWSSMAYVDRMVELGEIREVTNNVIGQDRVFVAA